MTDSTADNSLTNDKRTKKPRQRTERKKIQDRLAQRATREKTKQRIAALEEALSSLKSGDDASRTASLTSTIANLRKNNHRLQYTLDKIQAMISQVVLIPEGNDVDADAKPDFKPWASGLKEKTSRSESATALIPEIELAGAALAESDPFEFELPETTSITPSSPHVAVSVPWYGACVAPTMGALEDDAGKESGFAEGIPLDQVLEVGVTTVSARDTTAAAWGGGVDHFDSDLHRNHHHHYYHNNNNDDYLLDVFDQTGFGGWGSYEPTLFNTQLPPTNLEVTKRIAPDAEKWYVSNSAYNRALDSVKRRGKSAATMDFQTAFQAMLWGWQNVGREAEHPVWHALREVDQRIFGTWTSMAQRMAMMYVCQTLIQYRENPAPENLRRVPGFLRPRPAQERLAHPVVIDFLIWPGMRDRMIFEHEKYTATGVFSAAYVENFSFFWPYSNKEIFVYDHLRDRHDFSPVFLQYVYNYENWTMKPGFFEKYPEMRYDVPVLERNINIMRSVASF
ncbi:hypothetical protein AYL99_07140 [Fonsecaea erecta]|uniref:BZIP domain-containing protein n=1 Tax=Fonsecaea erecta TaxID=1367422 RepID=A0A178ZE06_9EURO|nr:hypothetical protein AYL99_07140 [Fonsecaea erecta]OAP58050.1 hypothetical protein AYL99_07140 [Fonsecaea erecta]